VLPLSNFGAVSFTNATVDNTAMGNENPGARHGHGAGTHHRHHRYWFDG
jgi:hypothetical protein